MNASAPLSTTADRKEASHTAPFAEERVILKKQDHIELVSQLNQYKSLHERALAREAKLKKQLAHEKAKVRDLNQRLYGKKSEQSKKTDAKTQSPLPAVSRPKGQQQGSPGHGRTERPDLPVITEIHDVDQDKKSCFQCGLPYKALNSTDQSDIIEISVKAYIRRIQRKKYVKPCRCDSAQSIITAAPVPRLLNRNNLGVSVWVEIFLDKFLNTQSTKRLLNHFSSLGCPISPGTIAGGLQRFAPLLDPLIDAFRVKQLSEKLFHADETGWKVFEKLEGKEGYRWYLWLIQSPSVAYYLMAPGRDAGVPTTHFDGLAEGCLNVFLVCDRYSAYGKLVKNIPVIVLAFCWAHVRRDFLNAARSWPELKDWMFDWVDDIASLYHTNNRRISHWDENLPLSEQSKTFKSLHRALRRKIVEIKEKCDACLKNNHIDDIQRSVLTSLNNHWPGLILFARHPQIKMDNNLAENSLRNPVTARKRFYGSGSIGSAHLAASMFTLFQTLSLWNINQRHWLTLYLNACAENTGKAPVDLSVFLPWEMTAERHQELVRPLPVIAINNSS
jgi:transposase